MTDLTNPSDPPPPEAQSDPPVAEEDAPFDAPVRASADAGETFDVDGLIVNIDGFEGPLDVLLELARSQKVDLRKISILALVEQYLTFVEAAKSQRLELAADYLVMASWLAFLKTKLLLPSLASTEDEPTADEMAARLAFQLQRLEAMREAAAAIYKLPRQGLDFFPNGSPSGINVLRKKEWKSDLFELLQAYTRQRIDNAQRTYQPTPPPVFSIEEARVRLRRILGDIPDWVDLRALSTWRAVEAPTTSVIASAFNAALEFAKDGKIEIRQLGHYEPVFVRGREEPAPLVEDSEVAHLPQRRFGLSMEASGDATPAGATPEDAQQDDTTEDHEAEEGAMGPQSADDGFSDGGFSEDDFSNEEPTMKEAVSDDGN